MSYLVTEKNVDGLVDTKEATDKLKILIANRAMFDNPKYTLDLIYNNIPLFTKGIVSYINHLNQNYGGLISEIHRLFLQDVVDVIYTLRNATFSNYSYMLTNPVSDVKHENMRNPKPNKLFKISNIPTNPMEVLAPYKEFRILLKKQGIKNVITIVRLCLAFELGMTNKNNISWNA